MSKDGGQWKPSKKIRLSLYAPLYRKEMHRLRFLHKNLQVTLINKQTIAPSQTRIVPLKLEQTDKFLEESLELHVKLVEHSSHLARDPLGRTEELSVTLNIRQLKLWDSSSWDAIRATFFFASTHPTYFLTTPPILPTKGVLVPPILALREFLLYIILLTQ